MSPDPAIPCNMKGLVLSPDKERKRAAEKGTAWLCKRFHFRDVLTDKLMDILHAFAACQFGVNTRDRINGHEAVDVNHKETIAIYSC